MMKAETKNNIGKVVIRVIFIVYLFVLAYFLFFSERYGRGNNQGYSYNLVPFQEIKRFICNRRYLGTEAFIVNIFGNILAFIPFGFFVPIVSKPNRQFFAVFLYSLEFSLGIELVQLSFQVGTFDVDDLLMNTIGGILGYLLFISQKKRLKKYL